MAKAYIPSAARVACMAKNGGACVACGDGDTAHVECGHIISEANGGGVEPSNLVPLCGACNRALGNANLAIAEFCPPIRECGYGYSQALIGLEARRERFARWAGAASSGRIRVRPYRP